MFPTGVGMNRYFKQPVRLIDDVPHRRGDEPELYASQAHQNLCSPQAWG